jgi:hypothetical protein
MAEKHNIDAPSKTTCESELNGASSIFLVLLIFQLNKRDFSERKKRGRK